MKGLTEKSIHGSAEKQLAVQESVNQVHSKRTNSQTRQNLDPKQ